MGELSSDEDIPLGKLKALKSASPAQNESCRTDLSHRSLQRYSKENCDFCSKVFNNRYTAIVHNAKHIIIPLLRPTVYQCDVCLYYFTSEPDLRSHREVKHETCVFPPTLRSGIIFEEDINHVNMLDKLTNDCKVNIEMFDGKTVGQNPVASGDEESIGRGDDALGEGNDYASLMASGDVKCRYCPRKFATRYRALRHNLKHMMLIPPRFWLCRHCEGYLSSKKDLVKHLRCHHKAVYQVINTHTCYKCFLQYYNWVKHNNRYHDMYRCAMCKNKTFVSRDVLLEHEAAHNTIVQCKECNLRLDVFSMDKHVQRFHTTLKVCDTCLLFMRRNANILYQKVGTVNVNGVRNPCDGCGNVFFELTAVHKIPKEKRKYRDRENKGEVLKNGNHGRLLGNEARLKSIQVRLKKINRLRKFK